MIKLKVAIIGGGVSGTFLAHLFKKYPSISVTIFEKSRGIGGRCSVKRLENFGESNLGVQFFTNRLEHLKESFSELIQQSLIKEFTDEIGYKTSDGFTQARPTKRYIGNPSMNSFLKFWTKESELITNFKVSEIEKIGPFWTLKSDQQQTYHGYNVLILTMPYPQGLPFWEKHSKECLEKNPMLPCWALSMITDSCEIAWPHAFIHDDILAWYSSKKIGHQLQWLLQCNHYWATEHINDTHETVEKNMIVSLEKIVGKKLTIHHKYIQRWLYAKSSNHNSKKSFHWDHNASLAYVGDWLCGSRVEDAMHSSYEFSKSFENFYHLQ